MRAKRPPVRQNSAERASASHNGYEMQTFDCAKCQRVGHGWHTQCDR